MKIEIDSLVKESNIKKVPYEVFGVHKNKGKEPYLLLAKTPIEVTIKDVLYRIVPMYKDIGVSEDGRVIDLTTIGPVVQKIHMVYTTVTTKDYLNDTKTQVYVHRLVALAWIDNDDYVTKNIVDHVDRDKLNNTVSNLRWVSGQENAALAAHDTLTRFTVTNMCTGKITIVSSLRKASELIGISYKNVSIKRLPLLVTHDNIEYILSDSVTESDIDEDYRKLKFPFKVTKLEGAPHVKYFKTKDEIYSYYNLKGWYKTIEKAKEELKALGYELVDINNVTVVKVYDVKNLSTEEEHKDLLLKDVISITGIPRGTVISRVNRKYKYGSPMGNWILKFNNDPEYATDVVKKKVKYKVLEDGKIFDSFRALAVHFGVDRKSISKVSDTEYSFRGSKITTIEC